MLVEEQVVALLARCEAATGKRLSSVRGNLTSVKHRGAAVWELLVIDAAAELGPIEYEPNEGRSPDILLRIPGGQEVWIEAAFAYPRFHEQEIATRILASLIFATASKRGVAPEVLDVRFDGDQKHPGGPLRNLPELHELQSKLDRSGFGAFLDGIQGNPSRPDRFSWSPYSFTASYAPGRKLGLGYGALAQESPKEVSEHALYRLLRRKAKRYDLKAPLIVCVGADESPAVSGTIGWIPKRSVIGAAFRSRTISGVLTVNVANRAAIFGPLERRAEVEWFTNSGARYPLDPDDLRKLTALNFNRWRYFSPLPQWAAPGTRPRQHATGDLKYTMGEFPMKVEVPAHVIIDSLAGKTSLASTFGLEPNHHVKRALVDGWQIVGCSLKRGDVRAGQGDMVVLELVPPFGSVFSQRRSGTQDASEKDVPDSPG